MIKQLYHNPTSQAERRAVLKNERDASTFHEFAHDDGGSRFKSNAAPRSGLDASAAISRWPELECRSGWR
jgi:hypothetical protein